MYLFWHFLFACLLALLLYRLSSPNPAGPYVITVVSAGVLPDLDHLLNWSPKYLARIFPWQFLLEGLRFGFRANVYPFILHFWIWPLILLAAAFFTRKKRAHAYLMAAAAGWALHLALDGVLLIA